MSKPVNVVIGLPGPLFSAAELSDVGVWRISVGSALARSAFGAFVTAARETRSQETFGFAREATRFAELEGFFTGKARA